jgi:NAD+ diphosphatase
MEYQFCPKCGSKAERKLPNLLICSKCSYNFYLNPSPTNAIIIENASGEILIAKRKFDPKKGFLDLPGGFVEPEETLEDSSVREAKEELGADIFDVTYFASYPDEYLYQGVNIKTIGFTLTAKIKEDSEIKPADDIEEARFYKKDEIPLDQIAFPSVRQGLIDYLAKKA